MRHAAFIASLVLLVVSSATADTIVLKNGRRIVASNVTEDGDHVTYETPAGQMSIPKSIVARIERDNFSYSSASSASIRTAGLRAAVEPVRGYEDVARLAVHDNAIDFALHRAAGIRRPFAARHSPSKKSPPRTTPPRNFW